MNIIDARAQTLAHFQNAFMEYLPLAFFISWTYSPIQTPQSVRYCSASPAGNFWRNAVLPGAPEALGKAGDGKARAGADSLCIRLNLVVCFGLPRRTSKT